MEARWQAPQCPRVPDPIGPSLEQVLLARKWLVLPGPLLARVAWCKQEAQEVPVGAVLSPRYHRQGLAQQVWAL
eukprot:359262-Amphidinium_carterae.1